ncbi:MAG: DnaJ domain-containing protein [Microbacteriaceae bacterium]
MQETSLSAYEVLGVDPLASHEEIGRAYRRLARATHPDLGGTNGEFSDVQAAWERIGKPDKRAAYDRERHAAPAKPAPSARPTGTYRPPDSYRPAGSRPASESARPHRVWREPAPSTARSYGHPGGTARERYLRELRLWLDVADTPANPYNDELVRSAPAQVRYWLEKARAEEATAKSAGQLGSGFTIWNDVEVPGTGDKVDHVLMGISGLYVIESASGLEGDPPEKQLVKAMRTLGKRLKAQFTALIVVYPDELSRLPTPVVSRVGRAVVARMAASQWLDFVRAGIPGSDRGTPDEVFEDRARLIERISFA